MSDHAQALIEAAKILEKTAEYASGLERENQLLASKLGDTEKRAAEKRMRVLRDKLASVTDLDLDPNLLEKLSSADPEVRRLVTNMAGRYHHGGLGGPSGDQTDKTAALDPLAAFAAKHARP